MHSVQTLLPLEILSLVLETVDAVSSSSFIVWSPNSHLRDNLFISLDLVDSPSTNIRGLILYLQVYVYW